MDSAIGIETFVVVVILICYVWTAQLVKVRKVPYLHESVVAIFLGSLTAVFIRLAFNQAIQFNDEMFFTFLLPPIIFAAGYNLRRSLFFQNLGVISFLGVVGTVCSFIVLSACINFINHLLFQQLLTLSQVMMLSSVLCATDTVTALSLIKQEESPVLSSVLFGQGVLNDAVAIIVFRSISHFPFSQENGLTTWEGLLIVFDFFYLLVTSLMVGLLFGFGLSFFLRNHESFTKTPLKESSLLILVAYASYLVSQMLNISGIISLFTCSVVMGHYCFRNLSKLSQEGTVVAFDAVGYLAQAFVYAYLGICILTISGEWRAFLMAFLVMLALPLSRLISVYILPLFYVIARKQFPMTNSQTNICFYAGLIRGAVAFALSLQIQSPNKQLIRTVTLLLVLITTMCGSVSLKSLMKSLSDRNDVESRVRSGGSSERPAERMQQMELRNSRMKGQSAVQVGPAPPNPSELHQPANQKPQNQVVAESPAGRWDAFESKYILPLVTRSSVKQDSPIVSDSALKMRPTEQ